MYKPKYKGGDKVRIRPDLNITSENVVEEMLPYVGNKVTITIILNSASAYSCYGILEDNGHFSWGDNMLVPPPAFKKGLLKALKEKS